MADEDDADDAHDDAYSTRLYVARWADGTAMIISAASMADVAGRLDEVGDPGTCEVVPLDGPLALVLRPSTHPTAASYLDASLDALDDGLDVQRTIIAAAFPALHAMIERRLDDDGLLGVSRKEWSAAVAREVSRKLVPSEVWASAIKEWWRT